MRYLTFIFFGLLSTLGMSQSFTVDNYGIAEGLPSAEVYDVFQDAKGFLWFATDNGVARFDGTVIETYNLKHGLTDPVVFGFFEDSKNRVWFRTFSGKLSYFDNGKILRYAHNAHLTRFNKNGFLNFIIRNNDDLVFSVPNVIGRIRPDGALSIDSLKHHGVHYTTFDNRNLTGLLSRPDPIEAIFIQGERFGIKPTNALQLNRVLCFAKWKGKFFFNLNSEVYCYDSAQVFKVKDTGKSIISMSVDKNDALWIGYMNGGVERFGTADLEQSWEPDFIKEKSVTRVMQDHEGGFWFTTLESGAFHIPNMLLQHYPLMSSGRIKAVAHHGNALVFGDQRGNLYRIDKTTLKQELVASFEPSIASLYQTQNSRLFVSTTSNIRIFDSDFKIVGQAPVASAIDYADDALGNLWAYGGSRLRKFRDDKCVWASVGLNMSYRGLFVDQDKLYLPDRTGLDIRDTALTELSRPDAFSDFKITKITSLDNETMLMSTIGSGFLLVNRKTLDYKIYNSQNQFIADNIYSVIVDYSDVWFGTEKGLVKVPISSLHADSLSYEHLTKKTGLVSDKIDFLALVNRTIWVFSGNWFSIIPLSIEKFETKKPIFYTRHIKANNIITSADDLLQLKHDQNNVHISFGFISFSSQNIYIRYRLLPSDPWSYTNDKSLLFSSLASGRYNLSLQYSTDRIHWFSADNIPLNILKPWWTEWYSLVLAGAIVGLIIFIYFRHQLSIYNQKHHYLKIITEHQQKLIQSEIVAIERERNRISKELHDRVGTHLTAIKLRVNQVLQSHKDSHAFEIEEQFQIAIREIKEIIYGLTPPSLERYGLFTSLKNYVGKLNKSIPIAISLKTYGKEVAGSDLNIILFRVFQELLNNSIKHSFAKNITIHINSFDDVLNILYEDDGIGFSYDPLQSGLGLDSIESRINSVNGTLKFDSGKFGICYTIDIPINTLSKEVV